MILGTVGTHTAPFDRLVWALDHIAQQLSEEVVVQVGASTYRPRYARYFAFATTETLHGLMARARVVVTHGGDTIIEAISLGVPVIVVARRRAYGEHIDDHQVDLARALSERGLVTSCEPADLLRAIGGGTVRLPDGVAESMAGTRASLVAAVRNAIHSDKPDAR